MGTPLLVEFFTALPEDAILETPDLPVSRVADPDNSTRKPVAGGKARRRAAIHVFCKQVQERYTEGTLLRLLHLGDPAARRAAIYALGLTGSPKAADALTACLHDEDEETARLTADALWLLWFRGDCSAHSDELYRLVRLRDLERALTGLTELIAKAPQFAEASNQRAIVHFRLGQYDRSQADCEAVLRLNPHHFGAQAGLAQCLMKKGKQRAALRAFKVALRIHPRLEGVAETVRTLENTLGDEGR